MESDTTADMQTDLESETGEVADDELLAAQPKSLGIQDGSSNT